jgi:hypothetical protein
MMKRLAAAASLLLLAACGGGGGGSAYVPAGGSGMTATPSPLPTTNTAGWQSTAKLTFSFSRASGPATAAIQRRLRAKPSFISPAATYMDVTVNSVNGSTTLPSWVPVSTVQIALSATDAQPNCNINGAVETCTIVIPAPPGIVNYTFTATDGNYGLSTQTGDQMIVQGKAATLAVTLSPIVNLVTTSMTTPTNVSFGASGSQSITVTAYDADGYAITGTTAYLHPITLTDPETSTSATTALSVNGGTAGATATISAPSDVVTLSYSGQAFNSFSFTGGGSTSTTGLSEKYPTVQCATADWCAVTAQAPNAIAFTGTTNDDTAHGGLVTDPNYNLPTLFFAGTSDPTQAVGVSETDFADGMYSGTFNAALDPASCGSGASAVATITANPADSFTVTPQNVGICKVTVSEAGSGYPLTGDTSADRGVFYISVTSSTLSANGHGRGHK